MEKITTKTELIERLKDIRAVEILAQESYERDVHIFSSQDIQARIQPIIEDEKKHIGMLSELIEMLSGRYS